MGLFWGKISVFGDFTMKNVIVCVDFPFIVDSFEAGYFYNFTRNIDKSWFEIPDSCPQFEMRVSVVRKVLETIIICLL